MALTTPNMGLIAWNQPTDPYDSTQLAGNFAKVDEHDHTPNKGLPITTAAIADGAITTNKLASDLTVPPGSITSTQLASNSVSTGNVIDGSLLANDLSSAASDVLGITSGGVVRRGKSIILTEETTTSTSFVKMTTPDQISNLHVPQDGLICVLFRGEIKSTVDGGAGRAVLCVDDVPVAVDEGPTPQIYDAATKTLATNGYSALITYPGGLWAGDEGWETTSRTAPMAFAVPIPHSHSEITDVNLDGGTPAFPRGGPCFIWNVSAGTHTLSVQYRTTSGTIYARNRHLYAWTVGF